MNPFFFIYFFVVVLGNIKLIFPSVVVIIWNSKFCKGINKVKTMSSAWFRTHVKRLVVSIGLQSAQFSTHSFRAGLATDLFIADTPLQTVQWAGRWRSVCALIYYRSNVDKHQKVAKAIQTVRKAHGDKLIRQF